MNSINEINEPPLRGPWQAWLLAAIILASYPIQTLALGGVDAAADRFGLVAASLAPGRWFTLLTALFIHGGWMHVAMNAAGALAFGAPVARFLGPRPAGVTSFFLFYLVCGVLSGLGYVALNPHSAAPVVGASGAVSGLFGAASRLIEHRPGLSPFASRTVVGFAAAWLVTNVVLGLIGIAPGIGAVQIAWQAHVVGYAAGLVLIGPWARLFGAAEAGADGWTAFTGKGFAFAARRRMLGVKTIKSWRNAVCWFLRFWRKRAMRLSHVRLGKPWSRRRSD